MLTGHSNFEWCLTPHQRVSRKKVASTLIGKRSVATPLLMTGVCPIGVQFAGEKLVLDSSWKPKAAAGHETATFVFPRAMLKLTGRVISSVTCVVQAVLLDGYMLRLQNRAGSIGSTVIAL